MRLRVAAVRCVGATFSTHRGIDGRTLINGRRRVGHGVAVVGGQRVVFRLRLVVFEERVRIERVAQFLLKLKR
jgi:hypothetical protein